MLIVYIQFTSGRKNVYVCKTLLRYNNGRQLTLFGLADIEEYTSDAQIDINLANAETCAVYPYERKHLNDFLGSENEQWIRTIESIDLGEKNG